MHFAEVIQMALRQPLDLHPKQFIETGFVEENTAYPELKVTVGAGLLLAGGLLLGMMRMRNSGIHDASGNAYS